MMTVLPRNRSLRRCEELRPQAGVGKLKHAPPMRVNDLPVVARAVPPAVAALIGAPTVREGLASGGLV